jgi:spore germination protein YaaH
MEFDKGNQKKGKNLSDEGWSDEDLLDEDLLDDDLLDEDILDDELSDEDLSDEDLSDEDILDEDEPEDVSYDFNENTREQMQREVAASDDLANIRKQRHQEVHHNRTHRSHNRINRKKLKTYIFGIAAGLILLVAIIVVALVKKYTPTKEYMSGYQFFDVNEGSDKVMVLLDGQQYNDTGVMVDGRLYIPQAFIATNINIRFYYDKESNSILYSDSEAIYSFHPDIQGYSDSLGKTYQTDYEVAKSIGDVLYLDFEFVSKYTNCIYTISDSPQRVVILTDHSERSYVTVKKETVVRYRAGIKSKILEAVPEGEQLQYNKTVDNWIEVVTKTGFKGYIKASMASDVFESIIEDTFVDNYTTNLKDHKINMAWFQVTGAAANSYINSYLSQVSGINTISPTWYSLSSEQGDVSCLATKDFVNSMHAKGLEVWPLIDDFNKDIDYTALFSSKKARTKVINTLMSDARKYQYDGFNIDFENIKSDFAQDYLQFIRELSIACQTNNIVLSIDNYKPEAYNQFYNIKEQAAFADYVVIMGYDEHYSGSEAGSVASISFVEAGIKDTLAMVPKNQVINAIPFFTRIWTIKGTETTSKAVGMQAAIDEMNASGAPGLWDEVSGQYFCSYEKNGAEIKIWFEEDKSIEEKMKLIKQYELGGVAEWKLGLEKPSVWNVISSYLNQ